MHVIQNTSHGVSVRVGYRRDGFAVGDAIASVMETEQRALLRRSQAKVCCNATDCYGPVSTGIARANRIELQYRHDDVEHAFLGKQELRRGAKAGLCGGQQLLRILHELFVDSWLDAASLKEPTFSRFSYSIGRAM